MATQRLDSLYDQIQEEIVKIQDKIDRLKNILIDLKRKRDHLCIIRDEDDKKKQIKMLIGYQKTEVSKKKKFEIEI